MTAHTFNTGHQRAGKGTSVSSRPTRNQGHIARPHFKRDRDTDTEVSLNVLQCPTVKMLLTLLQGVKTVTVSSGPTGLSKGQNPMESGFDSEPIQL